jgi:CDP-diglyceride synthetase
MRRPTLKDKPVTQGVIFIVLFALWLLALVVGGPRWFVGSIILAAAWVVWEIAKAVRKEWA